MTEDGPMQEEDCSAAILKLPPKQVTVEKTANIK